MVLRVCIERIIDNYYWVKQTKSSSHRELLEDKKSVIQMFIIQLSAIQLARYLDPVYPM